MTTKAHLHRDKIQQVIEKLTFEHQRLAAQKVYQQFALGHRAVILTAEMQSGKSGIALALGGFQRLSLNDDDICNRAKLKDTLFLVTMADVALQEQAAEDLAACPNVVVSNLVNFRTALLQHFQLQPPKLLIIDECHYGSASDAIRYAQLFDYIEKEARDTRIVLISATPFSALLAAGSESILRATFHTSLVFHKTTEHYRGVRQMHKDQQIVELVEEQRDFTEKSIPRNLFINKLKRHSGAGWALIRVGNNNAQRAKQVLLQEGFSADQIYIVGQKLSGVEDHELTSFNEFRRQYQNAQLFDEKIIAITVASFRAGINFGAEMKEGLIATWDSTISNIAAVVQANIGRACGYHQNKSAWHFTNLHAVAAYAEFLIALEEIDTTSDFNPIIKLFDNLCDKYQVNGFDRGIKVLSQKQNIVAEPEPALTAAGFGIVECIDGQLTALMHAPSRPDFPELAEVLATLEQYQQQKPGIAVRNEKEIPDKPTWLSVMFMDGQTEPFTDADGLSFKLVNAYRAIQQGGRVPDEVLLTRSDTQVQAFVFDCSNLAPDRDVFTRRMAVDDLAEICIQLGVVPTERLILLFRRVVTNTSSTLSNTGRYTRVQPKSVFDD